MRCPTCILLFVVLLSSPTRSQELTREMVDAVSVDSLMTTIRALERFGTRYEYTPQRDSAAGYLLGEFSRLGLQAESDWYSFGQVTLLDVAAAGNGALFMSGSSGVLLTSTDNGEQWTTLTTPPVYNNLYGIAFATPEIGCAVGAFGTLLRTTDRGNTWSNPSTGVSDHLQDVAFIADTLGIIVGRNGRILRTTDAGAHWIPVLRIIRLPPFRHDC
jgi:hypothetical protein